MDTRKILIIDDDEDTLDIVERFLSEEGYRVVKSSQSVRAVELAKEHSPDMIILDIKMPGTNGVEVTDMLKKDEQTCNMPIMYLTGSVKETEVQDGYVTGSKIGNIHFVPKPFEKEELLDVVKRILR